MEQEKKKFRLGLLPKVIIAIILGIVCSLFFPMWAARTVATFNSLFGNFLGFIIPLLILGLVAPGISEMGKSAGKLLLITVILAYSSTLLAGYFSYFTCRFTYPLILVRDPSFTLASINESSAIQPFFTIDMNPVFGVMTALILAFVLGLGAAYSKSETIVKVLGEFRDIINLVIKTIIIPLLPFFIFGIFLILGMDGQVAPVLKLFLKVILVIFAIHVVFLILQFLIAGAISGKNPFRCLWNMMHSVFCGYQSGHIGSSKKKRGRQRSVFLHGSSVCNHPSGWQHLEDSCLRICHNVHDGNSLRNRALYRIHLHAGNYDGSSSGSSWRSYNGRSGSVGISTRI